MSARWGVVMIRLTRLLLAGDPQRLRAGGDAGEPGRVVQVEVAELAEHPLGELPRLLEDEGVVGGRDQEDVHDAVPHQVLVLVKRRRPGALDVMEGPRAPRSLARRRARSGPPPGPRRDPLARVRRSGRIEGAEGRCDPRGGQAQRRQRRSRTNGPVWGADRVSGAPQRKRGVRNVRNCPDESRRLPGGRSRAGRLGPQGDRDRRDRDARPHGDPRGVREEPAPARAPASRARCT